MYGLPQHITLDFLRNRELIQLLVGQYQLILRFDADISISVESDFDHTRDGKSQLLSGSLPKAAASLLGLVGAKVARVENVGGGQICIHFSTRDVVCIKDSNPDGESYEIVGPNMHIIV